MSAVARGESRLSGELTRPSLDLLLEALSREREIRRAAEEARNTLEALHRRQEQFATMAAHELYTPFTSLLSALSVLERANGREDDAKRPQLVEICLRQARRLRHLVEDLVLVARPTPAFAFDTAVSVKPVASALAAVMMTVPA